MELSCKESDNSLNRLCFLQQTSCTYDRSCRGTSISGSIAITSGSESDLQAAVASAGPVAVAVDGSSRAFRVCMHAR